MKNNIKLSKQLIKIAKILISFNDGQIKKVGLIGNFGKLFLNTSFEDFFDKKSCGYIEKNGEFIVFSLKDKVKNHWDIKILSANNKQENYNIFKNVDDFISKTKDDINILGTFKSQQEVIDFLKNKLNTDISRCDVFKYEGLIIKDFTSHLNKQQIQKIIDIIKEKFNSKIKTDFFNKYITGLHIEFHDYNEEGCDGYNNFNGTIYIDTNIGNMQKNGKFSNPRKILLTIIHEMCHNILMKNSEVSKKINEHLKKLEDENQDGIFFKKGDIIEIDHIGKFEALQDFHPSLYEGKKTLLNTRNTQVKCIYSENKNILKEQVYDWNDISGTGRVIKINNHKVKNKMRSYGLQDTEQHIADNLSEYVMNTNDSKHDKIGEWLQQIIQIL